MNIIICDFNQKQLQEMFSTIGENNFLICDNGPIHNCIGCFGCWIKTPGQCVIRDGYEKMGAIFAQAYKLIIISECVYGGYSPFVKNVLDRSISYLLPFFKTINHKTHHKQRYKNNFSLFVYFYSSSITEKEKQIANNLVEANSTNFGVQKYTVSFFQSLQQLCMEENLC